MGNEGETIQACPVCEVRTIHHDGRCEQCVARKVAAGRPPPIPTRAAPVVGDEFKFCANCGKGTLWAFGTCKRCQVTSQIAEMPAPKGPTVVHVKGSGPGVVQTTITLAKFIGALIFLTMIGTCVYVCGSVANTPKTSTGK